MNKIKAQALSSGSRLQVDYRHPDELIPYANNPRKHSRPSIKKLQRSLKKLGWTNPILVDDKGNVICGHGRLEAAKLNGMTLVPVISLGQMSEADRRAYIIADNKLAERSKWSKEMLHAELSGLVELGYDIELTGFEIFEVDGILNFGDPDDDGDGIGPEPPIKKKTVSRVGDLWWIGEHRVIVGDARDPAVAERLLDGERAAMVITDPPYGCKIAGNVSGLGKVKHQDFVMGAGEQPLPEYAMTLLRPAFKVIAASCLAGAIAFVFIDWRAAPHMLDAAKGVFLEVKNLCVWVKNPGMGGFYRSAHELCYVFKVSPGKHINNVELGKRARTNVWRYPSANVFGNSRKEDLEDHPTVKSRQMFRDAILDVSRPRDIVFDPFAGSGTTGLACEMAGRRARVIELDAKYADVMLRRLAKVTKAQPLLEGKRPFREVEIELLGAGA